MKRERMHIIPAREEYAEIEEVWRSGENEREKLRQFVKLLKRVVWNQVRNTYQETAIRTVYSGIANLLRDDIELLWQADRLRRLGNVLQDESFVPSTADVAEAFKTLCQIVRKFTGQDYPTSLAEACDSIVFRSESRPSRPADLPPFIQAVVVSIDAENHILTCVPIDSAEQQELKVVCSDASDDLARLFGVGDRVCLVTPIIDSNLVRASEIVLEPDYLISPQKLGTALPYARPELYYWLSLFEDAAQKAVKTPGNGTLTMLQHVLRGDFANRCLADYCAGSSQAHRSRIRQFFQTAPAQLTAANPPLPWFQECEAQDANIRRIIGTTLPREHGVHPGQWQIEAPLYSPVYGLSARADALAYSPTHRSATILELKSGKWNTFKGDHPRPEHAVQPLFYGDLLYFSLGLRREAVHQLLFYSRTQPADPWNEEKQGRLFTRSEIERALPGGTIGRAIRHCIRVRNAIVALGAKIRSGEFRQVIEQCTPADFRSPAMSDKYWSQLEPELAALLRPLQTADELSKRYFYRQLSFLAEEEYLARLGENGADVGRGGSSTLWRTPVSFRQQTGLRLSSLRVLDTQQDELGRITAITLDTSRHPLNQGCAIRAGDSVCLYKSRGREDENITNTIVFSADVKELRPGRIVLSLRDPQSAHLFGFDPSADFAVEPAPSSFMSAGYSGLRYFLTGGNRRRDLVLNRIPPAVDSRCPLPILPSALSRRYPGISKILVHAWQAKDWFLIWGPPGTGKTSTAMWGLIELALATPGMKVLLLAYTYRATDEICRMLEKRLRDSGRSSDLYLRLGNPLKCDPTLRGRFATSMNFQTRAAVKAYARNARIVVGTVASVQPDNPIFTLFGPFDLAIVDEASQLLDTHILPLFCARNLSDRRPLVGKFVFIGDDRQLPAVVQQGETTSRIHDELLRAQGIIDCRHSFFQRLRKIAADNPALCGLLDRQYRVHPAIADVCNTLFYGKNLRNGDKSHQRAELPAPPDGCDAFEAYTLSTRLGFFDIVNPTHEADAKVNPTEAACCAKIIRTLLSRDACPGDTPTPLPHPYHASDIGIIVPFRNQIATIRTLLANHLGADAADDILVDTVERFQGSERPVIIFSTVIQNLFQADMISARKLSEPPADGDEATPALDRKLNVAITRARERFYLVGNAPVLRHLRAYSDLLGWISRHTGFYPPAASP